MSQSEKWENGVVLSFDLLTENLRIYFSENRPNGAYEIIKKYLKENGFNHLRDSDYVNKKIDDIETSKLLRNFAIKYKWFSSSLGKVIISPNVDRLDISNDLQAFRDTEWENEIKQMSLEKQSPQATEHSDIMSYKSLNKPTSGDYHYLRVTSSEAKHLSQNKISFEGKVAENGESVIRVKAGEKDKAVQALDLFRNKRGGIKK